MPRRKTTGETAGPAADTAALVPQPRGGALRTGGKPGNKGGGRPPDEVRARLLKIFDTHAVGFLERTLKGKAPAELKLRAVEIAARHTLAAKHEITAVSAEVQVRVQQTVQLIASRESWDSVELLDLLGEIWT